MNEQNSEFESTSRRSVLKWIAAAGFITPFLPLLGCAPQQGQNLQKANNNASPTESPYTEPTEPTSKDSGQRDIRSHLPPIIIGSKASLELESLNKLETASTAAPFIYKEDTSATGGSPYEALQEVRVITEMAADPYVKDVRYYGLPTGSQLLIWYQRIRGTPNPGPDCDFEPMVFDPKDPDVRIKGATASEAFSVSLKHKKFDQSHGNTHKCSRPYRYKQETVPGFGRFFRIGQWRIVGADGETAVQNSAGAKFEAAGDQAYTIFAYFH